MRIETCDGGGWWYWGVDGREREWGRMWREEMGKPGYLWKEERNKVEQGV
jgi:hypothetical protein